MKWFQFLIGMVLKTITEGNDNPEDKFQFLIGMVLKLINI